MAPRLPGPDRPPRRARWKVKPKGFKTVRAGNGMYVLPRNAGAGKPAGQKTTPGNRYTPGPTPSGNRPPTTSPGAAGGGTPRSPIPIDPYAKYREKYPWAWAQLTDIDWAEASHKQYAGQVGDWLSAGLRGLTGIDPNAPGYNPAVQQQYMANVAGQVGGALNAAAAATPMQVAATTPGGVVQGNNAFLGQAARGAAAQRSSAAIQMSQAQAALNTMQPNTFAQGAMRAYADMQAGLPALYATRRSEARAKIDQFIMESEEAARHNRVTEAISAQNAQTNAAISLAGLGLKADDQAFDQAQDLQGPAGPPSNLPPGLVAVPNDDGGWDIRNDPSFDSSGGGSGGKGGTSGGTSTRDARGRLKNPTSQGYVGGWKVKPKKLPTWAKGGFTQGADGKWYVKGTPTAAGGGSKSNVGKPAQTVYEKLVSASDKLLISDDQSEGTGDLLRFLRQYQPDKKNFAAWYSEIVPVLRRVDPRYAEWIVGWVMRRKKDRTWRGTF